MSAVATSDTEDVIFMAASAPSPPSSASVVASRVAFASFLSTPFSAAWKHYRSVLHPTSTRCQGTMKRAIFVEKALTKRSAACSIPWLGRENSSRNRESGLFKEHCSNAVLTLQLSFAATVTRSPCPELRSPLLKIW